MFCHTVNFRGGNSHRLQMTPRNPASKKLILKHAYY